MKVLVTEYAGSKTQERDLEDVLTPTALAYEFSGRSEETEGMTRKNSQMLGRLTALLVDKGVLTLDEALQVANCHDTVVAKDGEAEPWVARVVPFEDRVFRAYKLNYLGQNHIHDSSGLMVDLLASPEVVPQLKNLAVSGTAEDEAKCLIWQRVK